MYCIDYFSKYFQKEYSKHQHDLDLENARLTFGVFLQGSSFLCNHFVSPHEHLEFPISLKFICDATLVHCTLLGHQPSPLFVVACCHFPTAVPHNQPLSTARPFSKFVLINKPYFARVWKAL